MPLSNNNPWDHHTLSNLLFEHRVTCSRVTMEIPPNSSLAKHTLLSVPFTMSNVAAYFVG